MGRTWLAMRVMMLFRLASLSLGGRAAAGWFVLFFLIRIPREEALMAGEFGAQWLAYTRHTKRLLPGIF